MSIYSVEKLTDEARRLALEYRQATGKTLPITAEIAINDAIRLLELKSVTRDVTGYDAIMQYKAQDIHVQIKGRAIFNQNKSGYRLGQLKMEQDWQGIVLVIMNDRFETDEIYFSHRDEIIDALGNSEKNKKGSISVAKFKIIGELLWSSVNGREDNEIWSNQD